jgi:hypothetical protein
MSASPTTPPRPRKCIQPGWQPRPETCR